MMITAKEEVAEMVNEVLKLSDASSFVLFDQPLPHSLIRISICCSLNLVNLVIKSFFSTRSALTFSLSSCRSDRRDSEVTELCLSLQKLYKEVEDRSMLTFASPLDIALPHKDCWV